MYVTFTLIDYIKETIRTDSLIFLNKLVFLQGEIRLHKLAAILLMSDDMT